MRLVRFLFAILLLLAILAGAAYMFRGPLAGGAVRMAMARAGLENPQARVTALSPSRAVLTNVAAGPSGAPTFFLENVEVNFTLRELFLDRTVNAVSIGPGTMQIAIDADGRVSLPGVSRKGGSGAGALPFEKLIVSDLAVSISSPTGNATGALSAQYDVETGGRANVALSAPSISIGTTEATDAAVDGDVVFLNNGDIDIDGNFAGDIDLAAAELNGVQLSVEMTGASWRDLIASNLQDIALSGTVSVKVDEIPVESAPALGFLNTTRGAAISGGEIFSVAASSDVVLDYQDETLTLGFFDEPPVVVTDTGVRLAMAPLDDAPLLVRSQQLTKINFGLTLDGARLDAKGAISATSDSDGWRVRAPLDFGQYESDAISLDGASVLVDAAVGEALTDVTFSIGTVLDRATIGRLLIQNAPLDINGRARLVRDEKRAEIMLADECFDISRADIRILEQSSMLDIRGGEFCQTDKPALIIDWSESVEAFVYGYFTADDARYRLENTRISGIAPRIDFAAHYQPNIQLTKIEGDISGGAMMLNDALALSQSSGDFDFSLDKNVMRATVTADDVRIAQNRELPLVAPVFAKGVMQLDDKDVDFRYDLYSIEGVPLGSGQGDHRVDTGRGKAGLIFETISFAPYGLQPDVLAPVLKGVIGTTRGEATGTAAFSWSPGVMNSEAKVILDEITFGGPTRIVTQTQGLSGEIHFTSLWPIATEGVQTIRVAGVDLDALQLGEGSIDFNLPGDETFLVPRAEFPWFGGVLGVYSATASMTGGEAVAPMRADKIDLKQVFEYADIDGLSGEGLLNGVLPLVVEDGRARIENGILHSEGPGAIRYTGRAAQEAASAGGQAKVAFDLLRNLEYNKLGITINGPLDGRLDFQIKFEGTGDLEFNGNKARVPVIYNVSLDAALLELMRQANLSRDWQMLIERGSTSPVEGAN